MRRRKETEHEILTGTIEGWEKEVWLFIDQNSQSTRWQHTQGIFYTLNLWRGLCSDVHQWSDIELYLLITDRFKKYTIFLEIMYTLL